MQPSEDPSPFLRSVRETIRVRHWSLWRIVLKTKPR
jgi:hypothetical protein